ncbi:hypothetical protein Q5P01_010649 [Channa striata]|uniref:Palmdelphin n=1 Tax=Channa striata TaxID=64152 RepID=A0AA88MS21_CHASR|nr:hypothetical protein Q5P01_010649 [Channa striata]
MDESGLLRERFQAITEKHRIQEHIRLKKLELDQEKLKLQYLKEKVRREQWLLQDSACHSAQQHSLLSDRQQTRTLQLNIHKTEMEILSLEREESMVSTNESVILNRLRAVEKSPDEVLKEVQLNFVREPAQVPALIPPPLSANNQTEQNTPRKTLFANVTNNLQTEQNTLPATAAVPPGEFTQHIHNYGTKCVYALKAAEVSREQSCLSELSAYEVELLLRRATVHRQANNNQHPSREGQYLCTHDEGRDPGAQAGPRLPHVLTNDIAEKKLSGRETWRDHHCGHRRSLYSKQDDPNNLREGQYGIYQVDGHYGSCLMRNCDSFQEEGPAGHHTNGFIRSNSKVSLGCRLPRPSHQEVATGYQQQLSYYVSGDENDRYSYSHSQTPSPLCRDDTPYTILSTLDTSEPITAIFMGFQAAHDDSQQSREFAGALKAKLVIIENSEQYNENIDMPEESHAPPGVSGGVTGSAASGNVGCVQASGARQTEGQVGTARGTLRTTVPPSEEETLPPTERNEMPPPPKISKRCNPTSAEDVELPEICTVRPSMKVKLSRREHPGCQQRCRQLRGT